MNLALKKIGIAVCYVFSIVFTLYSWGPLEGAKWWIIDDYEIVELAGIDNTFSLKNIPSALGKTELSNSSELSRFRPSYYILRYSEIALWGNSPRLWYTTRIVIAIIFAVTLTWFCLSFYSPFLTISFLLLALPQPYWIDVYTRLGPAETYASLGFCLVCIGVLLGFRSRWNFSACAFLVTGLLICIGCKENFLFLTFLPVALLITKIEKFSFLKKMLFCLPITFAIWISFTVLHRLHISGRDIYAREISTASSLELLIKAFSLPGVKLWLGAIFILSFFTCVGYISRKSELVIIFYNIREALSKIIIVLSILLVLYIGQYFFYSNLWLENAPSRYLFPGLLFKQFAIIIIGNALILILLQTTNKYYQRKVSLIIYVLFFFILIIVPGMKNNPGEYVRQVTGSYGFYSRFTDNHDASTNIKVKTLKFYDQLNIGVTFLRNNPNSYLLIYSHNVYDFEPIAGINRFVKGLGIENSIVVKTNNYSPAMFPINSLEHNLSSQINGWMNGDGHPKFTAIDSISNNLYCYSFGLSGPSFPTCRSGFQIFPQ